MQVERDQFTQRHNRETDLRFEIRIIRKTLVDRDDFTLPVDDKRSRDGLNTTAIP